MSFNDIIENIKRVLSKNPTSIEELSNNIHDMNAIYRLGLRMIDNLDNEEESDNLRELLHCDLRRELNKEYELLYNMQSM